MHELLDVLRGLIKLLLLSFLVSHISLMLHGAQKTRFVFFFVFFVLRFLRKDDRIFANKTKEHEHVYFL